MYNVNCPTCDARPVHMAQIAGGQSFVVGEEADVLCFDCGDCYILTLTVYGWVSRAASPADRIAAVGNDRLNHVRTHYADYRDRHPGVWE